MWMALASCRPAFPDSLGPARTHFLSTPLLFLMTPLNNPVIDFDALFGKGKDY
jgi:hypothetical protein